MHWFSRPLEVPRRLRAIVRARESSVIVLALIVGALAGLVVAAMGEADALMHLTFFGLDPGERLSGRVSLNPLYAFLTPCLGGLLFGLATAYITRRRGTEVDPIEANALHGGRMSIRGSLIVAAQTVWSSGVGASVGLEAGYTQLASGIGSGIGRAFRLRRSDMRILVGCGGRVGAKDCSFAPLTEPDMRASHPALWIDMSELQHELGRDLRRVKIAPHRFERGHPSVEP